MNEGTFEAKLHEELRRIFKFNASIKISHQKQLSLRLGRNCHVLNSDELLKINGRLDVLVEVDDKPMAIFELKGPSIPIDEDDVKQGVSYARLMENMPPIVVISNGVETRIVQSYNYQKVDESLIDEKVLSRIINTATQIAATEQGTAVKLLLAKNPVLCKKVFKNISQKQFENIRGEVSNFSYPICDLFQIKRKIVSNVILELKSNSEVIFLKGGALSGKTNVMAQIAHELELGTDYLAIYVDATNTGCGLFKIISNYLAEETSVTLSEAEIRDWIRHNNNNKLVLLIDDWMAEAADLISNDIKEIANSFLGRQLSIVLAVNNDQFSNLTKKYGRETNTLFGKKGKVFELAPLDDEEVVDGLNLLLNQYRLGFYDGVLDCLDFRSPHLWRLYVGLAIKYSDGEIKIDNDLIIKFSPLIDHDTLNDFWSIYAKDPNIQIHLRNTAKAFILDVGWRKENVTNLAFSFSSGLISYETALKEVGRDGIKILQTQGFLNLLTLENDEIVLIPTVPELIASAGGIELYKKIVTQFNDGILAEEIYSNFKEDVSCFPFFDAVGSFVILKLAAELPDSASIFINNLRNDYPKINKVEEGSMLRLVVSGLEHKDIKLEGGEEESFAIENHTPWLILSNILKVRLGGENFERETHLSLLYDVARFPDILRRIEISQMRFFKPFHVHSFNNETFFCSSSGIIEPIVEALMKFVLENPELVEKSLNSIGEDDSLSLAIRLKTATNNLKDSAHENSSLVKDIDQKLYDLIARKFERIIDASVNS